MKHYTFIIESDGKRHQWTCKTSSEEEAWDLAYATFPEAKYIEIF